MSEPVRIVITVEKGLVSGVYTLGVPVEFIKIDYDTEGADDEDGVIEVGGVECFLSHDTAEPIPPELLEDIAEHWGADLPAAASAETFTRSKMAGYEVEEVEAGQWVPFRPDRIEFGAAYYATEREAWEACDRHRMFGDGDRREA